MRKVTLSKMEHKGEPRIRVDFPYDADLIQTIKQLAGSKWSQSKKCWHLPYAKESYALLAKHFEITVDKKMPSNSSVTFEENPISKTNNSSSKDSIQVLPEHDFRVKVIVPWQRKDWVTLIKTLPDRAWNKEKKYWSVPKIKATLLLLQQLFGEALRVDVSIDWKKGLPVKETQDSKSPTSSKPTKEAKKNSVRKEAQVSAQTMPTTVTSSLYQTIQHDGRTIKTVTGQKIIIEQEQVEWLRLYVPYDKKGWIAIVKDIPGREWQPEQAYWRTPYVQDTFKRLWALIGKQHIHLTFSIRVDIPKEFDTPRKSNKKPSKFQLNEVQKKAITAFEEKMLLENKAWRTRKTYKGLFIRFIAYFPDTKPSSITKPQIEQYIIYRKQDNISDSQLNQLINCLNCFFIRILEQNEKVVKLERPKKKRKLPNVYSLEEIELLLKAIDNLKHKCMLILVYSGGLRKSEVLNLRVDDLNFYRKSLFVKDAKGGKDRYTFFSDIARKYLADYLKQYQPKYYLFEGQTGGRYSESAIQNIFEKARKKARLRKTVTLHGLRHSFATHLAEKGVAMPAIQDLLGHASIKTTEIYLHLSNKYRNELKSPLDDLDL